MDNTNTVNAENKTVEVKQSFLSSAISDISAYIQLADTKVSIIMAAVVAIADLTKCRVVIFICVLSFWLLISFFA